MTTHRRDQCLLCGVDLEPLEGTGGLQRHPEIAGCEAKFTDSFGVAVDVDLTTDELEEIQANPRSDEAAIDLKLYPLVDEVLIETFDTWGLPKLGGVSSGRGWSSFSTYQRCPYLWRRKYVDRINNPLQLMLAVEHPALAIGTLVHVFLALHYSKNLESSPYRQIDLVDLHDRLKSKANPEFVAEAWRVFDAYRLYYAYEEIIPLSIEHDLRDPRTGESCRYDMIAFHPDEAPGRLAGTYIYEHKSAARFDRDTIDGWSNDGEILGEVALWKRLGLDHRFGPLQGVIVNIVGKQPVEPKFHRTIIAPTSLLLDQHLHDLKLWNGLIQLSKSNGIYPRARANCIGRYGRCDLWDHCAQAND